MNGRIYSLNDNYGYIHTRDEEGLFYFTKTSIVGCNFSDLNVGDLVEYDKVIINNVKTANCVRLRSYEWLEGKIIKKNHCLGDNNFEISVTDSDRGTRNFWFYEKDLFLDESMESFSEGDSVRFKCEGWYETRNQAFMVTKKLLGYITSYNSYLGKGMIDFSIPFKREQLRIPADYDIDTDNYFYLVIYDIDSEGNAKNPFIINKTMEITFDDENRWFDGIVEKKSFNNSGEYMIISDCYNEKMRFKINNENLRFYCKFEDFAKGQKISYALDDKNNPLQVTWVGYITRFPINVINKDMSARINTQLSLGEVEEKHPDLLYFRKNIIVGFKRNDDYSRFWIDVRIFADVKRIPIATYRTNLMYKVKFALKDDFEYGKKAFNVRIIGVAKAKYEDEDILIIKENLHDTSLSNESTIINNYYAPQNYNQYNNLISVKSA